jgi:hypothetical protein
MKRNEKLALIEIDRIMHSKFRKLCKHYKLSSHELTKLMIDDFILKIEPKKQIVFNFRTK